MTHSNPLILIVDDVAQNIQYLGNILKEQGYDISVAMNGIQALEILLNIEPDLILLDIMMPEMNGFDVCKNLKASPETKDIPVIFLTAKTETGDIVQGFELGAVDYITKPFNSNELLMRVKTHIELKRAREELIILNGTKDKFFSIIAHDLKGPVTALKSGLEFLSSNYQTFDAEHLEDLVKAMASSVSNVSNLLEDLLDWARSQTNRIQFSPSAIDIQLIVQSIFELQQENADQKNIELVNSVKKEQVAYADKDMIKTVIRNLVSNAIKFTPSQGKIVITTSLEENFVIVKVIDTGIGIPERNMEKLFKIDEQVSTIGTADERGSGLGLVLCKEFIDKNQGKLWVESQENRGSTFFVKLPISK